MPRQGVTRVRGTAAGSIGAGYFGNGEEGNVTITGDTPLAVTLDEGQLIKQYESLTINEGATLRPANRCNGMILLVRGDMTINGTISADKCAPLANPNEDEASDERHVALCNITGGNGGSGGRGSSYDYSGSGSAERYVEGAGGTGGSGFAFGGGYGGGGGSSSGSGPGGPGDPRPPVGSPIPYPGGSGVKVYGVGGTDGGVGGGGPGGGGGVSEGRDYQRNGGTGDAIGGGAIYIFVGGTLTIGATGKITANGGNGGNGSSVSGGGYSPGYAGAHMSYGGGGGGGGGGCIALIHSGSYNNLGSIMVNGGTGGQCGNENNGYTQDGNPGAAGTTLITTLAELLGL